LCTTYRKVFNDVVKDDKKNEIVVISHFHSIQTLETGPRFPFEIEDSSKSSPPKNV
jgi:hypothetical protein